MSANWEASLVAVTPSIDGVTFDELCGLPWVGLSVTTELSGAGTAAATVPVHRIEDAAKARLRDLSLNPLELWVRRPTSATTAEVVHAGPVIGCHIKGRDITITAPGLYSYLATWLRTTDYDGSGLDIATIVKQLVDQYQALEYGHLGFDTSTLGATGATANPYTISALEPKYLDAAIVELGQRSDGFDIAIDPATRALQIWTPRRGTDRSANTILDARSIGEPDLSWSVGVDQVFSDLFGTASSATGPTLTTTVANTALRSTMGRRYGRRAYTNCADQGALDAAAQRSLDNAITQPITITPSILPVTGFAYGDFQVGDLIGYDYDAGIGRQTGTCRVASITCTLDTGAEVLKVGFL